MKRLYLTLPLPLLLIGAGGCDPCFGVAGCVSEPRLAFEGELILHTEGFPYEDVAGVEVEFTPTGGVGLEGERFVTQTNEEGRYSIVAPAQADGTVEGDLHVRPPGERGYTVSGLSLETTRGLGEGHVFPQWVTNPYFPHYGEVFSRRTGQLLANARVEFRRTGGVELTGPSWSDDRYVTTTDSGGRFFLFYKVFPVVPGELIGELRIEPAGEGRTWTIRNVRLSSTHLAYHPPSVIRWGVGVSLQYVGEIHQRGGGGPMPGAEVEFVRVGGIQATPETFTATTDAGGRFPVFLETTAEGEVLAELRVRAPGASRTDTIRNVRVPTSENDEVRLLGVWTAGFGLNYVGELIWLEDFTPAEGVEVEFRRTGGIEVIPESFTTRTDGAGRFPLMTKPLAEGEVVFDLHVRPPGRAPVVIEDIRMTTTYSDQAELLGVWGIPPP